MESTSRYREIHALIEARKPREALAAVEPLIEAELRRIVGADPSDVWARFTLGRTLERQGRMSDALPHLRLAHAMSGDLEHEVAVLRVERRLGLLDPS